MIKTNKYGIIHAIAQCGDCDWEEGMRIDDQNRMQNLRNKIYQHIRKNTSHKVSLETGSATDYFYRYE